MGSREVSADRAIIKNIESKWESSREMWDDDQSRRFGEQCIPELTSKVEEMGEAGRAVAEEMGKKEQSIREILSSC